MRLTPIAIAALLVAGCQDKKDTTTANAADAPATVENAASPSATKAKATPSFDCARADGQAQELVCNDANLAAMDRELARVYALASKDSGLTPQSANELKAMQRGWAKGRDECWKGEDLRQCVMTSYAMRIHELRQGSDNARTDSPDAMSVGPVAFACDGLDALISATFINTDPGAVYLAWRDMSMALDHVPSGSGAKYEGRWDGQTWTLWTKGPEATFTMPGKGDLTCRQEEIG